MQAEQEPKASRYLTRTESAEYLTKERGLVTSVHTLARLIVEGKGPDSYTYGKRRRLYNIDDLNKWADARLTKHQSLGV